MAARMQITGQRPKPEPIHEATILAAKGANLGVFGRGHVLNRTPITERCLLTVSKQDYNIFSVQMQASLRTDAKT
jgi:hypothetical protein